MRTVLDPAGEAGPGCVCAHACAAVHIHGCVYASAPLCMDAWGVQSRAHVCVCVCVCVCVFGVGNMAISEAPPCPGDQVWLPPPSTHWGPQGFTSDSSALGGGPQATGVLRLRLEL